MGSGYLSGLAVVSKYCVIFTYVCLLSREFVRMIYYPVVNELYIIEVHLLRHGGGITKGF